MKLHRSIAFIISIVLLVACQKTPPEPVIAEQGVEFTLAPDQTATITDTGLTIKLISVSNDARCPSGIECAASGPVTLSLAVQQGNEPASNLVLQTFTDNNGRSPDFEFEGIKDRVTVGGHLMQVKAVMPYPESRFTSIKPADYRVTLVVTQN